MGTDLDRMLSTGLQARADAGSPIDPQPLLQAAVAKGRKLRTRRRMVIGAIAAVVVAGVAANTALSPRRQAATPKPSPSSSRALDVNLALLPEAGGQPGAFARPDLVGSDPGVLHFSVDALAAAAWRATWTTGPGVETANVQRSDFQVYLGLARTRPTLPEPSLAFSGAASTKMSTPARTSVDGREATLRTAGPWDYRGEQQRLYSFVWQPVDGLWARYEVQTSSMERALQILELIRFDQARQCVLPVRVGYLPAGASVPRCEVALALDSPGPFADGKVTVVDGQRRLGIGVAAVPPGSGEYDRPLKAGPYQVWADPNGRNWTMLVNGLFLDVLDETRGKPFAQAEVMRILGGLEFAEKVQQPATW